jgi:hypothetical protein
MMDQERTSKELQELFEQVQQSYTTLLDDVFVLQERSLELAWSLFESSAEDQAQNTQATLEDLARQFKSQRDARETLVSQSTRGFMKVLAAPYEDHSTAVEAKTDLEDATHS